MNVFLDFLEPEAKVRILQSSAASTLRAYNREWDSFCFWCHDNEEVPLPANERAVASYLETCAEQLSMSTLYRKSAAIGCLHDLNNFPSPSHTPAIKSLLERIRLTKSAERIQKSPLMEADVRQMVDALPINLLGERDRCLLLVGFAAGLQRSELVALDTAHVVTTTVGMTISIVKQNSTRRVVIPAGGNPATCPVKAYDTWLERSEIHSGPVFRWVTRHGQVRDLRLSDKSVSLVIKRAVSTLGKDPAKFSSQSLISGRRASFDTVGAKRTG